MNKDKTHLIIIVDKSGSMYSQQDAASEGINTLLTKQKDVPGECTVSLYEFDTSYKTIYSFSNLNKISANYQMSADNGTALYDALCSVIDKEGQILSDIAEQERPGLVAVFILTDGYENSSRKFTLQDIKSRIEHQTQVYSWQFTFLSSDLSALEDAKVFAHTGDVKSFSQSNYKSAYEGINFKLGRMRSQSSRGAEVQNSFTDQEIAEMNYETDNNS